MSHPQTIRFQLDSRSVDWQELVLLFKLANLGGREGDKVKRAFENSTVVCFATDGPRLVGELRYNEGKAAQFFPVPNPSDLAAQDL